MKSFASPALSSPTSPRRRPSCSTLSSTLIFTLAGALSLLSTPALAQAQAQYRTMAAYTQFGGQFYIHGGEYKAEVKTNQLVALDLTQPWPTAAPLMTLLPSSSDTNSYHVATHSPDDKIMFTLGRNSGGNVGKTQAQFVNSYNVTSKTWADVTLPNNPLNTVDRRDFLGALDPDNGKYIFIGGNYGTAGKNMSNFIHSFDTNTRELVETAMTPMNYPDINGLQGAALAWLGGNKIGVFGGYYSPTGSDVPRMFNSTVSYATGTTLVTKEAATGELPSIRKYPCVASSADGKTVVLYGGFSLSATESALGDLYILNVASRTWSKADPRPGDSASGYTACTIAGNSFIVWGGSTNHTDPFQVVEATNVFDISSRKWVNAYTPTAKYVDMKPVPAPAPPSGGGGSKEERGSKSSTAVIVGATLGSAAVIALIVLGLFYRKKRRERSPKSFLHHPSGYNQSPSRIPFLSHGAGSSGTESSFGASPSTDAYRQQRLSLTRQPPSPQHELASLQRQDFPFIPPPPPMSAQSHRDSTMSFHRQSVMDESSVQHLQHLPTLADYPQSIDSATSNQIKTGIAGRDDYHENQSNEWSSQYSESHRGSTQSTPALPPMGTSSGSNLYLGAALTTPFATAAARASFLRPGSEYSMSSNGNYPQPPPAQRASYLASPTSPPLPNHSRPKSSMSQGGAQYKVPVEYVTQASQQATQQPQGGAFGAAPSPWMPSFSLPPDGQQQRHEPIPRLNPQQRDEALAVKTNSRPWGIGL